MLRALLFFNIFFCLLGYSGEIDIAQRVKELKNFNDFRALFFEVAVKSKKNGFETLTRKMKSNPHYFNWMNTIALLDDVFSKEEGKRVYQEAISSFIRTGLDEWDTLSDQQLGELILNFYDTDSVDEYYLIKRLKKIDSIETKLSVIKRILNMDRVSPSLYGIVIGMADSLIEKKEKEKSIELLFLMLRNIHKIENAHARGHQRTSILQRLMQFSDDFETYRSIVLELKDELIFNDFMITDIFSNAKKSKQHKQLAAYIGFYLLEHESFPVIDKLLMKEFVTVFSQNEKRMSLFSKTLSNKYLSRYDDYLIELLQSCDRDFN